MLRHPTTTMMDDRRLYVLRLHGAQTFEYHIAALSVKPTVKLLEKVQLAAEMHPHTNTHDERCVFSSSTSMRWMPHMT